MHKLKIFQIVRIEFLVIGACALGHAQSAPGCAANITNPLQALVGTWGFSANGFAPATLPFASAGRFVASIGTDSAGNPIGRLSITNTSSQNGQITRLETDVGTYQVFPDCSGGTLVFNLSTRPLAFDFWFDNRGTELSFTNNIADVVLWGRGKRADCIVGCICFTAEGCPCCTLDFLVPILEQSKSPGLKESASPRSEKKPFGNMH